MPDFAQIRLYAGNRYTEIRLPEAGGEPIVTGQLIAPHANPVEVRGLLGGYEVDVVWAEGDSQPKKKITPPGAASKGKKQR